MKNSLSSTEWFFVATALLFMASILLIAKINARRASVTLAETQFHQEEILVTIDGAVKKPGQYVVQAGTTIDQVLRKARPEPNANLKIFPLKARIETPLCLTVEEIKEITVTVTGAIAEPVQVVLPSKSRISDLKSKVIFTDATEKAFFRRRKLLKDGDKIEVPKKTVENNSAH